MGERALSLVSSATGVTARSRAVFVRLWVAAGVSNVGDGLRLAALPLLAALLTRDPLLIAGLTAALRAPGILLALPAGVVVDRFERPRLLATVNVVRGGVVAALALAVMFDGVNMVVLYVVAFALGSGEIFFDVGIQALVPQVVAQDQLEWANGRLYATELVANEFAGPPLGSVMFVATPALPFAFDALSFFGSGLAMARIEIDEPEPTPDDTTFLASVKETVRSVWGHGVLRWSIVYSTVRNLLFGAVAGIFVLYALETLSTSATGFGILIAVEAVGGFLGSVAAARLRDRFGTGLMTLMATVALGIAYVVLGQLTQLVAAGLVIGTAAFGASASTIALVSLRQRLVDQSLLGRVGSVGRLASLAALTVGSLFGGLVAQLLSVPAVFTVSGVCVLLLAVAFAAPLSNRRIRTASVLGSKPPTANGTP